MTTSAAALFLFLGTGKSVFPAEARIRRNTRVEEMEWTDNDSGGGGRQ
jgi:hypothetical protein